MRRTGRIVFVLGAMLAARPAGAVPLFFSHQGRLLDAQDTPVDGIIALTVRLHRKDLDPTGEDNLVWECRYPNVRVSNGAYAVLVRDAAGCSESNPPLEEVFGGEEDRWIGISVDDDEEMGPRLRVGSAPFALRARDADALGGMAAEAFARAAHVHWPNESQTFAQAAAAALGGATVPGALTVQGELALGDDLHVQGRLAVQDDASAAGDLSVQGEVDVGDDLAVGGRLQLTGTQGITFPDGTVQNSAAASGPWVAGAGGVVHYAGGRVGVGTPNPAHALDVVGGANATELCIRGECRTSWAAPVTSPWNSSGSDVHYAGGNVGIGTTAPGSRLEVAGQTRITFNGSAANPSLLVGASVAQGTGLFSPGANILALSTADLERMRVDAQGRVGVGTASPSAALDVAGGVRVGTDSADCTGRAGTLRWNGRLEVCDGTGWRILEPVAPYIASVSPRSGSKAGGTDITISGTGFLSGAAVHLDSDAATNVNVVSRLEIRAKTPARAAGGTAAVKVTNPDGAFHVLPAGFTYANLGESQDSAAASCKAIKDANTGASSQAYRIDPNGGASSDAFQV